MKKLVVYLSAVLLAGIFMTACSSDNEGNSINPGTAVKAVNVTSLKVLSVPGAGTISIGASSNTYQPIQGDIPHSRATGWPGNEACKGVVAGYERYEGTPHPDDCPGLQFELVDAMDVSLIDGCIDYFLTALPERQKNLDQEHPDLERFATDFLYISNGQPITVIPMYTCATLTNSVNVFYYDANGVYHQQRFWQSDKGGWKANDAKVPGTSPQAYKNVDGKGFRFTLPKGTKFGFMAASGKGRHFTSRKENVSHAKYEDNTVYFADEISAVQFNYKDCNFIGIEDVFKKDGSDQDFNDVILCINPEQEVDAKEDHKISIDLGVIEKTFTCESDDTNIKVGTASEQQLVSIGKLDNTAFNLELEANTIFNITIDEIDEYEAYWVDCPDGIHQELVFDIRLYNHNLDADEIKALFCLDEENLVGENSYDIEGQISTKYSYKVNIGFDMNKESPDIHISPIIYRLKPAITE